MLNTIQKPVKLIERLVLASSNKGDLVLDPFSGVGTTAVVCEKLSRRFIGFEVNKEYIHLSKSRLMGEYDYDMDNISIKDDRQLSLF